MNLIKKSNIVYLNQVTSVNCHNFSTLIDIDIYKGGYGDLYYEITTIGETYHPENKILNILCLTDDKSQSINLDTRLQFYRAIKNDRSKYYIFIYEDLGIQEERLNKINAIL
jgi:hypothetical protein